jgi:hypothetical protein
LKKHAANLSFLIIALVALYWRVFFLGETLVDVSTLNNQLPWGYSAAPSDYPYNRRDLTDTYVTREYFVVQSYRDGEFPLWNPWTMAGHPIYADGVTRTMSPSLLFYRFFDVPLGYSLARITELLLGAILMYLFLLAIGAGARGALIGALIFEFSAHSMFHLTGLGWWGGLMWLPLILLFADRAATRRSVTNAVLAGVALAAQFFCGYLPNQIYYVGGIGMYYLLYWWFTRRAEGRARLKLSQSFGLMAVTLATGLALAATQWVPALELLGYSNRKIVGAELGYVYLPPWYALTLIFPRLFGSAYDTRPLNLFTALGVSHDHILYVGIVGLLMTVFCFVWLRWKRSAESPDPADASKKIDERELRVRIFAAFAVISLLIMMGAPLYVMITRFIPILQVIRVAVRASVLFVFAMPVLAAFGTEALLSDRGELLGRMFKAARRVTIAAVAIAMLGGAAAWGLTLSGFASEDAGRGKVAFLRRSAAVLSTQFMSLDAGLLLPLGLLALVTMMVWLLAKQRVQPRTAFAILAVLLFGELAWNSFQFDRSHDRSRVYPRTELTDFLKSLPPGRVLVVPSDLESNRRVSASDPSEKIIAPPNTLLPYQISTVSGKNQQFPGWYREFASLIEPQENLSHVVFDSPLSPYFWLLDVRYVLMHERDQFSHAERLATLNGVSVWEWARETMRPFFATAAQSAESPAEALSLLGSLSSLTTVVVEGGGYDGPLSSGTATIVEDKRNRVVIDTQNEGEGLLVLSDNYYPGWEARIDGSRVDILRANRTMRAVPVPAGNHVVVFEFKPNSLIYSSYLSAGCGAAILMYFGLAAIRRRLRAGVNAYGLRQDQANS